MYSTSGSLYKSFLCERVENFFSFPQAIKGNTMYWSKRPKFNFLCQKIKITWRTKSNSKTWWWLNHEVVIIFLWWEREAYQSWWEDLCDKIQKKAEDN